MPNVALIEPEAEAEPVERRFFSKAETRVLNVVFEACAEVPAVAFPVRQLMLLSNYLAPHCANNLGQGACGRRDRAPKAPAHERATLGKRDQRAARRDGLIIVELILLASFFLASIFGR